jgi:hypothetical protein
MIYTVPKNNSLDFADAMKLLKAGRRIRRAKWDKEMYWDRFEQNEFVGASTTRSYLIDTDITATDWEEYQTNETNETNKIPFAAMRVKDKFKYNKQIWTKLDGCHKYSNEIGYAMDENSGVYEFCKTFEVEPI